MSVEAGKNKLLRKVRESTFLIFVGGIVLYLLFGLLLWWALDQYIDPSNAEQPSMAKKDLVQALGFIMAGVAGVVGIYFTWRNLKQTQENTQETLWLTEQGQITERFTRAIDQLGATNEKGKKKLEIRLGGIYALERIARDSPERDFSTVMEVLTAYVRENAPWPPYPGDTVPSSQYDTSYSGRKRPKKPEPPPADIRAIMDVLRRGKAKRLPDEDESPVRLDLRRTNLKGADLSGADLRGARLRGTNLQGANLQGVNLWGAELQYADLRGANFRGAHLYQADLDVANLRWADLSQAEGITPEQLVPTTRDRSTKLPKGM